MLFVWIPDIKNLMSNWNLYVSRTFLEFIKIVVYKTKIFTIILVSSKINMHIPNYSCFLTKGVINTFEKTSEYISMTLVLSQRCII